MKKDWRALAALVLFVGAQAALGASATMTIQRLIDWQANGDPCQQARNNGGSFGICEPLVPRAEAFLFWTWIALAVLVTGFLIWIFRKPFKR